MRWLAILTLWMSLATGAVEAPPEREVAALFPKPGASVAASLVADLAGDGRPRLAVVWRTPLPGIWRLGLLEPVAGSRWRLEGGLVKTLPISSLGDLTARDLGGDERPELLVRGEVEGRNGVHLVYGWREGRLATLLELPDLWQRGQLELADLDGDRRPELVHQTGDPTVWDPAAGIVDFACRPYAFTGQRFEPATWASPGGAAGEALAKARRLAEGHLWAAAVSAAEQAVQLEASPATRAELWRLSALSERFQEQHEARDQNAVEPAEQVGNAICALLAGEHATAVRLLLPFGDPNALPAGWEVPWRYARRLLEAALAAQPQLLENRWVQFLRGVALLASGLQGEARLAFLRARSNWPQPGELARWAVVGRRGAGLYFLGPDSLLRCVEVGPDGRPRFPVQTFDRLGPLRSVAATPTAAAFALVPEAGDRVLWQHPDGSLRILLEGPFLNLTARAVSPDGQFLAVDSGTAAIRQLHLVEIATARRLTTVTYAGGFAWAPDSKGLVVEVQRPVEPPLPWEDGGTRDLRLIGLAGQELGRLADGDASSVWAVEGWEEGGRLRVVRTLFKRQPGSLDARISAVQRRLLDPRTGLSDPLPGPAPDEADAQLLARLLSVPVDRVELPENLAHPFLLPFRHTAARGTELWLLCRDYGSTPFRVGPCPPLTEPLVASWGALPGAAP